MLAQYMPEVRQHHLRLCLRGCFHDHPRPCHQNRPVPSNMPYHIELVVVDKLSSTLTARGLSNLDFKPEPERHMCHHYLPTPPLVLTANPGLHSLSQKDVWASKRCLWL
ncbi:hypothetical protein PISMIDRAFT_345912 [Pisolithus microcarpus 441]|uniref:Uncharacterized protein n=1 Tax=Pisolithus microcarpus 441 TaxID=765257 RepID=A0A0C9YLH5_9AGAM|nr:hypothetical protein BKA83DRAFT_345912 [Pisolithus microcarpus]KIK14709.1 hypothetical protein PISMIDRAFT_345912 [Pisolithus microcarpus 441]